MLSLDTATYSYEPFPIGCITDVFPKSTYAELCRTYPDVSLFKHMPKLGNKYSLAERNNPEQYEKFLNGQSLWRDFYVFVKSDQFIRGCIRHLASRNIDLGIGDFSVVSKPGRKYSNPWARLMERTELRARFEFSMMNGQGGHILPHTDEPKKIITLVMTMVQPGEWKDEWGGGTQVCWPKDRTKSYNFVNKYMQFDEVDVLSSYGFVPNQCIIFVKTYNSWHQVAPMQAPDPSILRRTLTINIEKFG